MKILDLNQDRSGRASLGFEIFISTKMVLSVVYKSKFSPNKYKNRFKKNLKLILSCVIGRD